MRITIDTTTEPRASAIDAVKFLRYFFNITAAEIGDVVNEIVTTLKAPIKAEVVAIRQPTPQEKVALNETFGKLGSPLYNDPPGSEPVPDLDPAAVFGANPFPQPAPSTAAATPLPIAPVGPQVGPVTPAVATSLPAAQPAPTAPVPINPAVPTIHASGVEIDADGLPWDSRIHATTKNKTQKGVWKARKGLNDEGLVNRVKTELKALMAMPVSSHGGILVPADQPVSDAAWAIMQNRPKDTVMPITMSPQGNVWPMITARIDDMAMPVTATRGTGLAYDDGVELRVPVLPAPTGMPMPTPPAATIPIPPAPTSTGTPSTMLELMPRVTSAVLANKLPQNALLDAVVAVGMPSIPSLQQRPDMVPEVWNRLNALYPGVLV